MSHNSISDKLKVARKHLGKDQKEMAGLCNMAHRSWQRYEQDEGLPSGKVFEALACLGFNINWFFSDDVPMLTKSQIKEDGEQQASMEMVAQSPVNIKDGDYVHVPRYEVAASAGTGAWVESEQIVDYLSFRAEWVRNSLRVQLNNLALINVIGDSMEPTLADGDVVLLDTTSKSIQDSAIYVLQMNGTLLVKRIQHRLDGSLVVKSDNLLYEAEIVTGESIDQLRIVGRVVWSGRKM